MNQRRPRASFVGVALCAATAATTSESGGSTLPVAPPGPPVASASQVDGKSQQASRPAAGDLLDRLRTQDAIVLGSWTVRLRDTEWIDRRAHAHHGHVTWNTTLSTDQARWVLDKRDPTYDAVEFVPHPQASPVNYDAYGNYVLARPTRVRFLLEKDFHGSLLETIAARISPDSAELPPREKLPIRSIYDPGEAVAGRPVPWLFPYVFGTGRGFSLLVHSITSVEVAADQRLVVEGRGSLERPDGNRWWRLVLESDGDLLVREAEFHSGRPDSERAEWRLVTSGTLSTDAGTIASRATVFFGPWSDEDRTTLVFDSIEPGFSEPLYESIRHSLRVAPPVPREDVHLQTLERVEVRD